MMENRRSRWVGGIGAVLVVGILILAIDTAVTQARDRDDDDHHQGKNPFQLILGKLDQIIAAIAGIGSSGGQEGNHTLRWDQNLPAAQRFVLLAAFANAAVLDRETGLVWQQQPEQITHDWNDARSVCTSVKTGGRKGWRLPSVHELASLIDPAVVGPPGPTLPVGHPFLIVMAFTSDYWSATSRVANSADAYFVRLSIGDVGFDNKAGTGHAWCVRGGMNADQY